MDSDIASSKLSLVSLFISKTFIKFLKFSIVLDFLLISSLRILFISSLLYSIVYSSLELLILKMVLSKFSIKANNIAELEYKSFSISSLLVSSSIR